MARKLLLLFLLVLSDVTALKLVQVVILSRHNVRAPMSSNLEKVTPKVWPKWRENASFLTTKGALLEGYMGEYFSQWLEKEGLFDNECPEEKSIFIYANALQRTRETAKEFVNTAFKNCNVTVHFKKNVTTDPIFEPVVRNTTEIFKQKATEEMQRKLDEINLVNAYRKVNKILDFNNSRLCKETDFCDLTEKKDEILLKVGEEPDIYGPLSIGNSVIDAFLMAYYNGTSLQNIGWGGIEIHDWELLTRITKENQYVRFNGTFISKHLAQQLLREINQILSNDNIKFALLVGHDSNMNSVLTALKFKPFMLPDQYERTPVGGKLVFQKWFDETQNRFLLKVNYVYQTTDQIRNGLALSWDTPPKSVQMEIHNCAVDENGFCDWTDFLDIIGKCQ